MTNEARQIEQQWSLRRERARYEAERARRQYDAQVEPENSPWWRVLLSALGEDRLRAAGTPSSKSTASGAQRDPYCSPS